jgi:hypothetical protein
MVSCEYSIGPLEYDAARGTLQFVQVPSVGDTVRVPARGALQDHQMLAVRKVIHVAVLPEHTGDNPSVLLILQPPSADA